MDLSVTLATRESEAGGWNVQGQHGELGETLSQNKAWRTKEMALVVRA